MRELFFFQNLNAISINDNVLRRRQKRCDERPYSELSHVTRLRIARAQLPDRDEEQGLHTEQPAAPLAQKLGEKRQMQLVDQRGPEKLNGIWNTQCDRKTDRGRVDTNFSQPECHGCDQQRQGKATGNSEQEGDHGVFAQIGPECRDG